MAVMRPEAKSPLMIVLVPATSTIEWMPFGVEPLCTFAIVRALGVMPATRDV